MQVLRKLRALYGWQNLPCLLHCGLGLSYFCDLLLGLGGALILAVLVFGF